MSASIIGKGATANLTTTEGTVFDVAVDGVKCQMFSVFNNDATNDALIRIPQIHGDANWFPVKPLQKQDFIITRKGAYFNKIYGKSSASTVSISAGPTAGD